jgi:hypothetical protein
MCTSTRPALALISASIAVLLGAGCTGVHAADDAPEAPDQADAVVASTSLEPAPNESAYARASAAVAAQSAIAGAGVNDAPRFIRSDSPGEARPSLPGYRSDVTEMSYRWWKSNGRADVGLGLGTLTYTSRPTGSVSGPPPLPGQAGDAGVASAMATGTVLTMGMRYRTSERSAVFADAASARGPGLEGTDGVVGKVGVEFKSAQSRLNIAYGGLGMRLAGDTRMTLRLRRGGLGVFMKHAF